MRTHHDIAEVRLGPTTEGLLQTGIVTRARAIVLASPSVRDEAVARGRTLLGSPSWCKADEVAEELVRCYVGHLVP